MPDEVRDSSNSDSLPDYLEPIKLRIDALNSSRAISALGLVAGKMLLATKQVTLQVSRSGFIEIVPPGELELDLLEEQSALRVLVDRGYTDQQMASYLAQRADRNAHLENSQEQVPDQQPAATEE